MSTEDPLRGVELLDFMLNEDNAASNITDSAAATAKAPLLQPTPEDVVMYDMYELNTSILRYPENITQTPTWEIAIKVQHFFLNFVTACVIPSVI